MGLASRGGAFLYSGHGAGFSVCPADAIAASTAPLAPVALVIGCSSHRPAGKGWLGSAVPAHSYAAGGSATAVGCLWDVTDGDVDRLTARLLAAAAEAKDASSVSVGALLREARAVCRLPHLTGAAVVCSGVDSLVRLRK